MFHCPNTFYCVKAFDWNGQLLVDDSGDLSTNSNVMIVPGRGVGDKDDVVIVVMPHFLPIPVSTTPPTPLPFPNAIPVDGIHGGAIVGGPGGEGNLFVPREPLSLLHWPLFTTTIMVQSMNQNADFG